MSCQRDIGLTFSKAYASTSHKTAISDYRPPKATPAHVMTTRLRGTVLQGNEWTRHYNRDLRLPCSKTVPAQISVDTDRPVNAVNATLLPGPTQNNLTNVTVYGRY